MDVLPEILELIYLVQASLVNNLQWFPLTEAPERHFLQTLYARTCAEQHGPERGSQDYSLLKSRLIQVIVHSLICQQLGVRSLLDDLAIVDNHNFIGIRDRRKTMRDHKGCTSL